MVRTPASGWPPAPDAAAGQVAHAARDRLDRAGVGSVGDVGAVAADPWLVTVTLTGPAPAAVPVIRETLAPVAAEVVWYEGASEVADEAGCGPPGNDAGPRGCGACGAPWRSWPHTADVPVAGAPVAVAGSWDLCTVCHGLVEAGDEARLRRRMARVGGLGEGEVDLVVRALLARTGR